MSFVIAGNSASTGYNLTRSLRFRSSASAGLYRTLTAGNQKTWTWSGWVKRGTLGSSTGQSLFDVTDNSTTSSAFYFNVFGSGTTDAIGFQDQATSTQLTTSQVFRDPSAWYHLVLAVDTTQATASNRVKLYVNGSQVTSFTTATYPALNANTTYNQSGFRNSIGMYWTSLYYFDGYLTEINFIDGQALTPSSFGSTNALTGVWQPARYTGTYGTNGFYLPFTDNSALTTSSNVGLGKDFSGNGNYWATNNISITSGVTYDSMTDVPTLTSATASNFAVLNPLDNGGLTVGSANLNSSDSAGSYKSIRSTIGVSSGKWYWEVTATSGTNLVCGVSKASAAQSTGNYVGVDANGWGYAGNNGQKYTSGSGSAYGSSYTSGDVIGIAFDADAGTLTFYKNNSSQGTAFTGLTSGPYFPAVSNYSSGWAVNFGQRPFTYTPPTGYVALNTYNLPTPTILAGNTVMDATLYTGNGGTITVANAAGFKPDLVWTKSRSTSSSNHLLTNSITGNGVSLMSNNTNAEGTRGSTITSTGFSYTYPNEGGDGNYSGVSYVGWQWQAGQGTTSSNTSGTITSTVSVNASAGFSVVSFAEPASGIVTVGHGLNIAPALIIAKSRNASSWAVYHQALGNAQYLLLQSTASAVASAAAWNSTSPTSSVFSVGTDFNGLGNMIAYCFAPIAGYSAFGSYTGNGSTDGPMIYTGFQPKWVLVKNTNTSTYDWWVWDSIRNNYNQANLSLTPDLSIAETNNSNISIDTLSNGFKIRGSNANINGSSNSYIYAAFATSPFKYSNAF